MRQSLNLEEEIDQISIQSMNKEKKKFWYPPTAWVRLVGGTWESEWMSESKTKDEENWLPNKSDLRRNSLLRKENKMYFFLWEVFSFKILRKEKW